MGTLLAWLLPHGFVLKLPRSLSASARHLTPSYSVRRICQPPSPTCRLLRSPSYKHPFSQHRRAMFSGGNRRSVSSPNVAAKAVGTGLTTGEPLVIEKYLKICKHPELFDVTSGWKEEWFESAFLQAIQSVKEGDSAQLRALVTEESAGVYSFPMMKPEFCSMFIEELDNYKSSGLPIRRPNSMNNYGIVVNDIGMEPMLSYLQRDYLHPIGAFLFPTEGSQFDAHHSFMVQYKEGEDLGLDMHTDDSDVTFNLCLGKEFTAAGLTFCGMIGDPKHRKFTFAYQHRVGHCVVHLGRKRHGADDIQSGERNNLIIWNHNHAFRATGAHRTIAAAYSKEADPPDLQCLSYTHDRDYVAYKELPEQARGSRPWCPPQAACYDQMDDVLSNASVKQGRTIR